MRPEEIKNEKLEQELSEDELEQAAGGKRDDLPLIEREKVETRVHNIF